MTLRISISRIHLLEIDEDIFMKFKNGMKTPFKLMADSTKRANMEKESQKEGLTKNIDGFERLFSPKSIAIVGVSDNPLGGLKYFNALKYSGYLDQDGN